jgi:hypothetical protein
MAIIAGSPEVYRDVVYVGISTNEEILAIPNSYQCCTFRDSVVAVDANTEKVLWKTYAGAAQRWECGRIQREPRLATIRQRPRVRSTLCRHRQQLRSAGLGEGMC